MHGDCALGRRRAGNASALIGRKVFMFDKRLFSLAPGVGRLVAAKVLCQWVGLLSNVVFVVTVVVMLSPALAVVESAFDPMFSMGDSGLISRLFIGFGYGGFSAETYVGCVLAIVVCAVLRFLMMRAAAYFGAEAAERVKLALREQLFNKMLAIGPSYSQHISTADVVQSAGEGIEQIQSFFELFLPQLFYAILAPVTLFFIVAPINMPTAVTLLVCAPLIVLIVGMVAMRAARVFKKYWGKYTDMGSVFLDNVQGLETLKTFDADAHAAKKMGEQAEQFRVMTMNVLQIQLRSLTAMDVVAYGGAAAGVGVSIWQYASGAALPLAGVLLIVLLSADFFIPLRQLGSFFHVAMNGMTSTKRIFALLDTPIPAHGMQEMPEFGASDNGVDVCFDDVSFRYVDVNTDAAAAVSVAADTAVTADMETGKTGQIGGKSGVVGAGKTGMSKDDDGSVVALHGVSFTARRGQVTAIVGPSGSGKSTAVELLSGNLSGYEGCMWLQSGNTGNNSTQRYQINDLSIESLTREIAIVAAQSHLFAGTLRDNLLMAKPDATESELWQALEAAHISDFVRAQSQELDLAIEQGASNLSGGQKQRIAIARALLREPAVYIFDEATSSVDVESETLILQTIRALADRGKTVIMVTHRMANAADADHVVVFEHGRVAEQGTHAELMRANGTYAKLFHAQQTVENIGLRNNAAHSTSASHALKASDSAESVTQRAEMGLQVSDSAETDNQLTKNTAQLSDSPESVTQRAETTSRMSDSAETDAQGAKTGVRMSDSAESDAKTIPTSRLIARLLKEVGPQRKYMIVACVCGTLGHLAATFLPVFGIAAAFAAVGSPVWNLSVPAALAAMAVCALIRGGMRYAEQFMNHNVAFRLLALFRAKAFAALRRLAPAKLAGKGKGDLIALVTTDVELLEIFFAHTISPVVIAIVTAVVYALALLTLSPPLAATLIIAHLIIGVILPKLFASAVRGIGPELRKESSALDDEMLDDMRGIGEIIRFGQGDARLASIQRCTRSLWVKCVRLSVKNGDFAGFGAVLVMLFTAIAAFLAMTLCTAVSTAADMSEGLMWMGSVGSNAPALVAAFVLLASSFGPTLALSALPANLTQTFASARRLFALMDEAPAVVEQGSERPEYQGMTMRDVTFGYGSGARISGERTPNGRSEHATGMSPARPAEAQSSGEQGAGIASQPVLDHVSLDVSRQGILGIQGPSGRGKSTMLKLLMRYWDPDSGTISLSDVPLPQVDAGWRRRVQTMMGQETYLFDGTIRENLAIACNDADFSDSGSNSGSNFCSNSSSNAGGDSADSSESDLAHDIPDSVLREALAKASALELVDALPNGLDTQVGELGGRLSEGEKQRIGLARMFLRDSDLVLFDEPTSRLDAYNESVILGSINDLAERGSAVVLVSHRDSTMRIADRILRM
ncbi:ATP-binding cassette domain-containing protein [Bifidobacterium pseudocatenulatum]|nr:ATP-binding cassette domain-containing protein [Bifidobacterium pseudocatenulatum]MZL93193.1 ATP-binding cassette domain-containing protein [Bifidobacterium pseudocatenulatum]MZL94824.1 ATP-binding cassette domain-containing protein [Bifidobacterium pseudocatenulatum]MZL96463.1 ATP-binding cassette domain-containing protein [Bifidobacterium pseudocatenulatum]MZL98390.1 ATP-binding cassette domain-containing protein [Bifidobacterium pseudocatenulatum]